jgi:hypothetical protein
MGLDVSVPYDYAPPVLKARATNAFGYTLGILIGVFCVLFVLASAWTGIHELAMWVRSLL